MIELAFKEDWRALPGEIALCAASGKVDSVIIVAQEWEDQYDRKIKDTVSIMNDYFYGPEDIKYGVGLIMLPKGATFKKCQ